MNKYYTPTIEEFHVGFEYEDKLDDHNFINQIFGEDRDEIYIIEEHLNDNRIRVKYLDQEDIESLGWLLNENKTKGILENIDWWFHKNKYQLRWFENNAYNAIFIISPNNLTLFDGAIKNKSELKKLMQQLGITE